MTLVSTPALHDRFFLQLSSLSLPHELGEVRQVCEDNKQEIVGPVVQE
jgi:hypothetical protein